MIREAPRTAKTTVKYEKTYNSWKSLRKSLRVNLKLKLNIKYAIFGLDSKIRIPEIKTDALPKTFSSFLILTSYTFAIINYTQITPNFSSNCSFIDAAFIKLLNCRN